MQIEEGEYFAVVRGFELGPLLDFHSIFSDTKTAESKCYDRSYDGDVFIAVEICGPQICAKRIYGKRDDRKVGQIISLNTDEIKVWPLTKRYVEALLNQTA